jgi:magnesium transporter
MPNYKKISNKISEIIIPCAGGKEIEWYNIINPGKEELNFLRKMRKYDFNFAELRASSSKVQAERPIVEKKNKYFFIILHFPVIKNDEVVAAEIDFFLSHGFLATLHDEQLKPLNDFFNTIKKGGVALSAEKYPSAAVLLAELLEKVIADCYRLLDENSAKINNIEKKIFAGEQKRCVSEILALERNVINIRRIIISHKNILKKMVLMKSSVIPSAIMNSFYFNLIEQTKRIWEFSEVQKETVEALRNTNESLLNFRTNSIIKTLTIVSVIFTPLSFIVALLTMSVKDGMPFLNTPNGFWLISGSLATIGLIMVAFFAKKKWL